MHILSRASNTGINKGVQSTALKSQRYTTKLAKGEVSDSYAPSSSKTDGKTSKFNIVKHNFIKFKTPKDVQQKVNDIFKAEGAKKGEYKSPKELAQALMRADKSIKDTPYFQSKLAMVKDKMSDEHKKEFVMELLNEKEKLTKEYNEKLEVRKKEATKQVVCNKLLSRLHSDITKMKDEKDVNKRMEFFKKAGEDALKAQKLYPLIKLNASDIISLFVEILKQVNGAEKSALDSFVKYQPLINDKAISHYTLQQKKTLEKVTNSIMEKTKKQAIHEFTDRLNNI